jgi:hypothetical protein
MTAKTPTSGLLTTVDVRDLNTLRWGPMRAMFPHFAEEIELGRYLKKLLATDQCHAVRVQLHRDHDGRQSTHVYDIYPLDETDTRRGGADSTNFGPRRPRPQARARR